MCNYIIKQRVFYLLSDNQCFDYQEIGKRKFIVLISNKSNIPNVLSGGHILYQQCLNIKN